MVACEICFALILSVSAGLLVQAFRKVLSVDPGFRPENVLTFGVSLPDTAYDKPEQKIAYYDSILARLRALPGVKAAGATSAPRSADIGAVNSKRREDKSEPEGRTLSCCGLPPRRAISRRSE